MAPWRPGGMSPFRPSSFVPPFASQLLVVSPLLSHVRTVIPRRPQHAGFPALAPSNPPLIRPSTILARLQTSLSVRILSRASSSLCSRSYYQTRKGFQLFSTFWKGYANNYRNTFALVSVCQPPSIIDHYVWHSTCKLQVISSRLSGKSEPPSVRNETRMSVL